MDDPNLTFEIGALVCLKSGGPTMTVVGRSTARCVDLAWFHPGFGELVDTAAIGGALHLCEAMPVGALMPVAEAPPEEST